MFKKRESVIMGGVPMNEISTVSSSKTDLMQQGELYKPMLYYGSKPTIKFDYVSDIHLLHHVRYFDNNINKTLRLTAKSLYESTHPLTMPLFLGDISSDRTLTVSFYKQFRINVLFPQYKRFKRMLLNAEDISELERRRDEALHHRDILAKYISQKEARFQSLRSKINKYINYRKVIAPKGRFDDIKEYLVSSYYKKRNLPDSVTETILKAAAVSEEIYLLQPSLNKLEKIIFSEIPSEPVTLSDFKYESGSPIGLVILGNHEYIGFANVEDAVAYYKKELEPLGYIVLQNEFVEFDRAVIYGGSGFAKYDQHYNANNLLCCDAMMGNRTYEIEQTTLFEDGYQKAKKHALESGKCFICAAHYPVESCLDKFDRETVYFTGHTHKNKRILSEDKALYADNQIGYHNNGKFDGTICFKSASMDPATNPYIDFKDGYYQTTPDAYFQFCDYVGENIGYGKLIRNRCETGTMYVIKAQGYYGFFLVNASGLSIVNGGMTKKIALSTNIEWIYNNFGIVVRKYLAALEPLRLCQMQISKHLKELGFEGTIHGLIVDINIFNHIMVNPTDGSITFYYSPDFGLIKAFESFSKQLAFMGYTELLEAEENKSSRNNLILYDQNGLDFLDSEDPQSELTSVDRSCSAYGVSRAISPLQRLFTGHVLRDFDLRFIENMDGQTTSRKKSYIGRVYMDKYQNYHLIVRDDLGEIIYVLDEHGKESAVSVQRLKSSMSGKVWSRACWMTNNINETVAEYGKSLPQVDEWQDAIQKMLPKKIKGNN